MSLAAVEAAMVDVIEKEKKVLICCGVLGLDVDGGLSDKTSPLSRVCLFPGTSSTHTSIEH